jgi:hypothetical protein
MDRPRVALVLAPAAAKLEHVFRDRGTVDFPAVSMAAVRPRASDAPTDLNLRLDYQLRHILVDEFQDTQRTARGGEVTTADGSAATDAACFCRRPCSRFTDFAKRNALSGLEEGIGDGASMGCTCE